jgi:predicted RNase H-like HicB family nuclease
VVLVPTLVDTPYGRVAVKVAPGDITDTWWARLEEVPEPLRHGGPTLATGATRELAISVLKVAIERFEQDESTRGTDVRSPATAYQDVDGKWVVDVPTEGVSAIGPTLDRAISMASELVSEADGLDVTFRNQRRLSA